MQPPPAMWNSVRTGSNRPTHSGLPAQQDRQDDATAKQEHQPAAEHSFPDHQLGPEHSRSTNRLRNSRFRRRLCGRGGTAKISGKPYLHSAKYLPWASPLFEGFQLWSIPASRVIRQCIRPAQACYATSIPCMQRRCASSECPYTDYAAVIG